MKKPLSNFIVILSIPLSVYALVDIAANVRGVEDKFENFISGYSFLKSYLHAWLPVTQGLPNWFFAYVTVGFVFKFSLIMVRLLRPWKKQPTWFDVLITTIRHILAWPVILINFLVIWVMLRNKNSYKLEGKPRAKNEEALEYLSSILQYIGLSFLISMIVLVALGAW